VKKHLSNILFVWLPLFFLVAYVVSYFAVVEPKQSVTGASAFIPPLYNVPDAIYKPAFFLFGPLYYLDAKIMRRAMWKI
jgi:hypothetical protein